MNAHARGPATRAPTQLCPHCRACAELERHRRLRWRCAVCGGPVVPSDGAVQRSGGELANLVGAQRGRAAAFGWTAAGVTLAGAAAMAFALAGILWFASSAAALVLSCVAAAASLLAWLSARRAKGCGAQARARLDAAWELVAGEVLVAQSEMTAPELALTMRTEPEHAEALLQKLSAQGRVRVAVREDAELGYRYDAGEEAAVRAERGAAR